jgi:hypothetical protein
MEGAVHMPPLLPKIEDNLESQSASKNSCVEMPQIPDRASARTAMSVFIPKPGKLKPAPTNHSHGFAPLCRKSS